MKAVADPVPAQYLVRCLYPSKLLADDTPAEEAATVVENLQRHKDCYKIHNALVELLINRQRSRTMTDPSKPPREKELQRAPSKKDEKK